MTMMASRFGNSLIVRVGIEVIVSRYDLTPHLHLILKEPDLLKQSKVFSFKDNPVLH